MCNGLSGFYHKSGTTFFIEPDDDGNVSHGEVLKRIPKKYHKDEDMVAFEFPDWTEKSFHWDHPGEIPDWADKNACVRLLKQVKPIWKKYEKVWDQAWGEYMKVCDQAQDNYEKVWDRAWTEMIDELSKINGYLAN